MDPKGKYTLCCENLKLYFNAYQPSIPMGISVSISCVTSGSSLRVMEFNAFLHIRDKFRYVNRLNYNIIEYS